MQDAIQFPSEKVEVAKLCLEDVGIETHAVFRQCKLKLSGEDESKAFFPIVHSEKRWLLTANPAIFNEPVSSLFIHGNIKKIMNTFFYDYN